MLRLKCRITPKFFLGNYSVASLDCRNMEKTLGKVENVIKV